jgi:hypothetical protein
MERLMTFGLNRVFPILATLVAFLSLGSLLGCQGVSSSSSPATPPLGSTPSVTISPATATVQAGLSEQFTATVKGSTNTAVTWLVNGVVGGNSTLGTISSSGLYTSPRNVPSGGVVTVTAQSSADPIKSASAAVTIPPAVSQVTVTVSPSSANVVGGSTQQFTATVTGVGNTTVNWSVNGIPGGNASVGTISASGLYSAPAFPSASNATITAVSAYDSSASANAVVVVSAVVTTGNYYVATTGSDSNDGSASHPWATIQHASDQAQPGWVIHIEAGTYDITQAITTTTSGSPGSPITFVGDGYDPATKTWPAKVIDISNADATVWQINGAYVTIRGIELSSNYSGTFNGIKSSAAHTIIENSHIHNITDDGQGGCIVGGSGSDYMSVLGNMVHNCGTSIGQTAGKDIHGLYLDGYYATIENNLIYLVSGTAIHLYSYGATHPNQEPWHSIISNNTIFYSGKGILTGADCGSSTCGLADYNDISNNIVYNLVDVNTPSYGIYNTTSRYGTHNTIAYNLVYDIPDGRYVGITYTNDVDANPEFMNYQPDGSGDYRLNPGSPAIDAGTSTDAPSVDFDGFVRTHYDLGVYEYF